MPSSKDRKKETEKATKSKSSSKEKKKKSSSKDRRSKSPTRSRKKPGADRELGAEPEAPTQRQPIIPAAPPPPLPPEKDQTSSSDFEAGLLFQRFATNGGVDAKSFQRMWRERDKARAGTTAVADLGRDQELGGSGGVAADRVFEFGQLFQKYDTDGDGRLGRAEFERMIGGMLDGLGRAKDSSKEAHPDDNQDYGRRGGQGADKAAVETNGGGRPKDVSWGLGNAPLVAPAPSSPLSGGGAITHYDETTGVPLSREAVASQQTLGHTVVPLNEAYSRRLSRLQTLLSSRLMPVREQLLQLRRRYHTRADEVKAARATIERETMADGGVILERLRSAEALKQAKLTQGVNDVTAELEGIERISDQVSRLTAPASIVGLTFSASRYAHDPESTGKMVELIQSYRELCGCIDSAASKPFDKTVDVRVDDLPHETAERLEVLQRADHYERALSVKEHMLWTTIQESHALEERYHQERNLGQEFAEEAQKWVALAGRLSDDVNALKKEVEQTERLREENTILARENRNLLLRLEELEGRRLHSVDGQGTKEKT